MKSNPNTILPGQGYDGVFPKIGGANQPNTSKV
jgi:hypothetical protein